MAWPDPGGVVRLPAPLAKGLLEVAEHDTCPKCGNCDLATFYRNGQYESRRTGEIRQCVVCPCGRSFKLPLGIRLPTRDRISAAQRRARSGEFIVANDPRPRCPFCGSSHITRRGRLRWSQRWYCARCDRRFVSKKFRHATLDRRRCSKLCEEET